MGRDEDREIRGGSAKDFKGDGKARCPQQSEVAHTGSTSPSRAHITASLTGRESIDAHSLHVPPANVSGYAGHAC